MDALGTAAAKLHELGFAADAVSLLQPVARACPRDSGRRSHVLSAIPKAWSASIAMA